MSTSLRHRLTAYFLLGQGLIWLVLFFVVPLKQSGLGREGGRQGTDEFLETKYLAIST